jgi:hypothetical protein
VLQERQQLPQRQQQRLQLARRPRTPPVTPPCRSAAAATAACCTTTYPTQIPKRGRGAKGGRPVNRDRFISKMFLRGDSVILVLRNPK